MKLDWKRWAFLLVPLLGVVELGLHVKQVYGVVPERDWLAARDVVKGLAKPDDLVVFAPSWTDPLGRRYFGKDIATLEREARPDDTRFPRAIEVSIRGEHDAELAGWHEAAKQKSAPSRFVRSKIRRPYTSSTICSRMRRRPG